ncbi:VanW family protein [Quadrisphaera sp. KR29]|uniref:VanW family protein n=1 Tax=Quadrisphaera sp. KR29 TaxID=3461391 RepID=UPI0040444F7E
MGEAGGAAQLLEMLERASAPGRRPGSAGGPGGPARVPAPRAPQHRLEPKAAGAVVVLPETSGAPVLGPAPATAPPPAAGLPGHQPEHQQEPQQDHRREGQDGAARGQRARVLALVAGAGLVAAAWSGVSAHLADRVPEGTTVAGVAIGGMHRDDAVRLLSRTLAPRLAEPLQVRLDAPGQGQRTTTVDPSVADLRLDAAATAARAIGPVGLPTTLWRQVAGGGAVAPVLEGREADLAAAVDRAAVALDVPAVEGSISFASGQPVAVAPVTGTALDREAAVAQVRRAWLAAPGAPGGQRPLPLPARTTEPQATAAAVQEALQAQALPAVSAPLTVVVGGRTVVLPPAQVLPSLSVVVDGPSLRLHVDGAALAEAVAAADPATSAPAQDARLDTSTGAPVVVPAVAGSEPDPRALSTAAAAALVASGEGRTAQVATRQVEPALSTEALAGMGISALLGQVVSPLTADPARTQDVTAAARALDGAVLAPGEPLDVGARMGEPSEQAGWVPARVVVDGRATTTLAAGTTQVASAVHAAAFAAGLQVDARTAPESWNPRDPVGLDAVVGPGAPLVLTEATSTGALLRVEVVDGVLRVQVWGPPTRQVTLTTSAASDVRPPVQLSDPSPQCAAQPGQDGFTTTVVRTTTPVPGSGRTPDQEEAQAVTDELTTTYAPRTAVTCTAPGAGGAPGGAAPALD